MAKHVVVQSRGHDLDPCVTGQTKVADTMLPGIAGIL